MLTSFANLQSRTRIKIHSLSGIWVFFGIVYLLSLYQIIEMKRIGLLGCGAIGTQIAIAIDTGMMLG